MSTLPTIDHEYLVNPVELSRVGAVLRRLFDDGGKAGEHAKSKESSLATAQEMLDDAVDAGLELQLKSILATEFFDDEGDLDIDLSDRDKEGRKASTIRLCKQLRWAWSELYESVIYQPAYKEWLTARREITVDG